MDKQEKTILNGRYKIIRPVGYGGMAQVFLAHDEMLDRNVAIKMLRDQFLSDNELLEQFQREAKSAARLVMSILWAWCCLKCSRGRCPIRGQRPWLWP